MFDGGCYCGALVPHFRGWDALDADGVRIGTCPEDKADGGCRQAAQTADGRST